MFKNCNFLGRSGWVSALRSPWVASFYIKLLFSPNSAKRIKITQENEFLCIVDILQIVYKFSANLLILPPNFRAVLNSKIFTNTSLKESQTLVDPQTKNHAGFKYWQNVRISINNYWVSEVWQLQNTNILSSLYPWTRWMDRLCTSNWLLQFP